MKEYSRIKIIADDEYFKNQDLKKLEDFVKKASNEKLNNEKIKLLKEKVRIKINLNKK